MLLPVLISLLMLASRGECQGAFLAFMKTDPNITDFCKLISVNVQQFFDNPEMAVFVPSNAVLSQISLTGYDIDKVVQNHMFLSRTPVTDSFYVGTTGNWTKYPTVQTRSTLFYVMKSWDTTTDILMSSGSSAFYVNAALVTVPNKQWNTQVYHVIDKVFLESEQLDFLASLKKLEVSKKITRSAQLWRWLFENSRKGLLPPGMKFKSVWLTFSRAYTATILLPTDDAWKSAMPDSEFNALMNTGGNSTIEFVMSRFYMPAAMHFWRNNRIEVLAGFVDQPSTNTAGLKAGVISADAQVNFEGYTARIVDSNIQIKWGVLHIIDNPMYKIMTSSDYLELRSRAFHSAIRTFSNLTQYLQGNYAIMALDDITIAKLTNTPQMEQVLLNCFVVISDWLMAVTKPVQTAGKLFIRVRIDQESNRYVDTMSSNPDENTWMRVARVVLYNQLVGTSSVSTLNGSISQEAMTCRDMFAALNASLFHSLLVEYKTPLDKGSPYTLLVPNDTVLRAYLFPAGNASAPGAGAARNPKVVKYVLQRMIVANRLVLQTKNKVAFRAATMNHAAMQETVAMRIVDTNLTVSVPGLEQSFSFAAGGFYCAESALGDASRYNLLYPVPFVLDSPDPAQGAAANLAAICVEVPCGAARALAPSPLLSAALLTLLWLLLAPCQLLPLD